MWQTRRNAFTIKSQIGAQCAPQDWLGWFHQGDGETPFRAVAMETRQLCFQTSFKRTLWGLGRTLMPLKHQRFDSNLIEGLR